MASGGQKQAGGTTAESHKSAIVAMEATLVLWLKHTHTHMFKEKKIVFKQSRTKTDGCG